MFSTLISITTQKTLYLTETKYSLFLISQWQLLIIDKYVVDISSRNFILKKRKTFKCLERRKKFIQ
jgi:hypothetical protein